MCAVGGALVLVLIQRQPELLKREYNTPLLLAFLTFYRVQYKQKFDAT